MEVKEEEKAQVVTEKVQITSMAWLRGLLGNRDTRAIMDMPWDPAIMAGPRTPGLDQPLLTPQRRWVWTLRSVMHRFHHKMLRRWVWVHERGVHTDKRLRVGWGGGGFRGYCNGSRKCRWGKKGKLVPPSDKGVQIFETAKFNVFTPDLKKGGGWAFPVPLPLLGRQGAGGYAGS